jgi:hypothetical protein
LLLFRQKCYGLSCSGFEPAFDQLMTMPEIRVQGSCAHIAIVIGLYGRLV